jgi:hypothetical protein
MALLENCFSWSESGLKAFVFIFYISFSLLHLFTVLIILHDWFDSIEAFFILEFREALIV